MQKTTSKHTKNYIKYVGVELEGYWHDGHDDLKHDGSVHFEDVYNEECDGNCRDHCECYSFCECSDCQACEICDNITNECKCDECLICSDCGYHFESCRCTIESICKKETCTDNDVCDNCMENFQELQNLDYSCDDSCNSYNNCEMNCSCSCECECECDNSVVGEVSSHKLKINEVEKWILNNYPNEVNSSTGLHIHLSFKNDKQDYSVIATEEFYEHFINELKIWCDERKINQNSRFRKRLNGVEYAKRLFLAEEQINGNNERYTQINYCYHKFGTTEIRVGNMFNDKTISVEYVQRVIRIFNEYLSRVKPIVYRLDEVFECSNNKKFDLKLRIKQQKDGLMVYAKSAQFENNFKHYNSFTRCINSDALLELDELNDGVKPNISFLRLKGLQHGSKLFIKGLYTKNMVYNYLDRLHDTLTYDVRILDNDLGEFKE